MRSSAWRAAGILFLLAGGGVVPASAQGDQAAGTGRTLFESRCIACHSLDANRVGPMLRGVVGRRVASVAGYNYSDALAQVKGRWDARRLQRWLTDPQSVAPGARMAFSLSSAADRKAVIEYLASTGSTPGAAKR